MAAQLQSDVELLQIKHSLPCFFIDFFLRFRTVPQTKQIARPKTTTKYGSDCRENANGKSLTHVLSFKFNAVICIQHDFSLLNCNSIVFYVLPNFGSPVRFALCRYSISTVSLILFHFSINYTELSTLDLHILHNIAGIISNFYAHTFFMILKLSLHALFALTIQIPGQIKYTRDGVKQFYHHLSIGARMQTNVMKFQAFDSNIFHNFLIKFLEFSGMTAEKQCGYTRK